MWKNQPLGHVPKTSEHYHLILIMSSAVLNDIHCISCLFYWRGFLTMYSLRVPDLFVLHVHERCISSLL